MPRIIENVYPIEWNEEKKYWNHLKKLKLPKLVLEGTKIEMLLGTDNADLITGEEVVKSESNAHIAKRTPLGWCCMGPMNSFEKIKRQLLCVSSSHF